MATTKPIRNALRAVFYPHVISLGFEVDTRMQPELVVFRRFAADAIHVFNIQWDKYHRPKFVINFSAAPLGGVDHCGRFIEPNDISPVHCGTYLRLVRRQGRLTYSWFQQRRPVLYQLLSLRRNYEPDEIAAQVVERFAELEDWWATKKIGPHVQTF